jgi:protein TonB
MFRSFAERTDHATRRRLAFSSGASALVYGAIIGAILVFARDGETIAAVKEVAVVFQPPPPPAPAPPPVAKAPVPKPIQPKKRIGPPPPRIVEVKEIPDATLEQAEPASAAPAVEDGSGDGSGADPAPAAPPPPPPPPPAPAARKRDPVNLPESATPPVPDPGNAPPEYPEDARAKGLTGQVILKVVISETGHVTRVMVMRGEEPFLSAAVKAVSAWRYTPALIEGRPAPVFRILKIPFRLQ